MDFLHCRTCGEILRETGLPPSEDEDLRAFGERHAGCDVARLVPTGAAVADVPWCEPLAERYVEVSDGCRRALLVGSRTSLEEPLRWSFAAGEAAELLEVELDREAFWADVDAALHPHHLPVARLEQWRDHLARVVRCTPPEDVLLLDDSPEEPWVSRGCLTATARARVEASLRSFGFDPSTEALLSSAFNGAGFPPLRITRRLVTASPGPGGGGEGRDSVGGTVPPTEP